MVRRWSYLNLINTTFSSEHKALAFAHHYVTFKATTYYRKSIHRITKLSRRSWSRRKHIHNWLLYQNLLANWAQDYLFFRKYNRWALTLNLFRNSYLTHNLLILKKASTTDFAGSEEVVVSNFVRRIIRYSSKLNPQTYHFFHRYVGVEWMYVTTPLNIEKVQESSEMTDSITHLSYQSQYYAEEMDLSLSHWLQFLINLLFTHHFLKTIELYKVFTLLTLTTIY